MVGFRHASFCIAGPVSPSSSLELEAGVLSSMHVVFMVLLEDPLEKDMQAMCAVKALIVLSSNQLPVHLGYMDLQHEIRGGGNLECGLFQVAQTRLKIELSHWS